MSKPLPHASVRTSMDQAHLFPGKDLTIVAAPTTYDMNTGHAEFKCLVSNVQFHVTVPSGSDLSFLDELTIRPAAGAPAGHYQLVSMGGLNDDFDVPAYTAMLQLIQKSYSSLFY